MALTGCLEDGAGGRELRGEEGSLGAAATEEAVVRHVIDGDTVVLEDGTRVRILLVDAP